MTPEPQPAPSASALFMSGAINWQAFIARYNAERAAQGLPPEPSLLPTLLDLADRMDARRVQRGQEVKP